MSEINDHEGGPRSALHTNSGAETNWSRNLLTAKRSLIVYIKALITNLNVASAYQLSNLVTQFEDNESSVEDFIERANNARDPNVSQLLEVDFYFEQCCKTLDSATRRALDNPNEDEFHNGLEPADSVSQVTAPVSAFSTSSQWRSHEGVWRITTPLIEPQMTSYIIETVQTKCIIGDALKVRGQKYD